MNNETVTQLPFEFRHFLSAKLFFTLGLRMISTIVIYQVFHLANTYMVGLAGLTEFLPAVFSALFAGHFIDTHDKKKILATSYICYVICAIALALVSLHIYKTACYFYYSIFYRYNTFFFITGCKQHDCCNCTKK